MHEDESPTQESKDGAETRWIEQVFSYQKPSGNQPERYEKIRRAARDMAYVINASCPGCADKSAAYRKLRECVMTANASIALENI